MVSVVVCVGTLTRVVSTLKLHPLGLSLPVDSFIPPQVYLDRGT
jgi:hypothetical protein